MKFNLPSIIPRASNLDQLTSPFTHDEIDKVVKEMPLIGRLDRMALVVLFLKIVGQSFDMTSMPSVTSSMMVRWM